MSDNATNERTPESNERSSDKTVEDTTGDQAAVSVETEACNLDDGEDETETEHTIVKEETVQYQTTFEYDDETQELVIDEEEKLDSVNMDDPFWSCTCGETFMGFSGASDHAEVFNEDQQEETQ